MFGVMNRDTSRTYPNLLNNNDSTSKSDSSGVIEDRKHKYSKYEKVHGTTATNAYASTIKKQTILREMRRQYKNMKTMEVREKKRRNNYNMAANGDNDGVQLTKTCTSPDETDNKALGSGDNNLGWYDAFTSDGDDVDETQQKAHFPTQKDNFLHASNSKTLDVDLTRNDSNGLDSYDSNDLNSYDSNDSNVGNYRYINKMSAKYQISVEEAELYYSQMLHEELQEEEHYLKEQENENKKKQLELQLQDLEEQEQMDIQYLLENFKIE